MNWLALGAVLVAALCGVFAPATFADYAQSHAGRWRLSGLAALVVGLGGLVLMWWQHNLDSRKVIRSLILLVFLSCGGLNATTLLDFEASGNAEVQGKPNGPDATAAGKIKRTSPALNEWNFGTFGLTLTAAIILVAVYRRIELTERESGRE